MTRNRRQPGCRGISLVESVLAAGMLSGAVAASLNVVGQAGKVQTLETRRATAMMLAQDLMTEIRTHDLAGTAGVSPNKPGATRMSFNDAEDFIGWSSSPPVSNIGKPKTDAPGWSRSVAGLYIDPDTFALGYTPTDAALFAVTVSYDGVPIVTLRAILTTEDNQ